MSRLRLIRWIPAVLSAAVILYSTLPLAAQQSGPRTDPDVESSIIPIAGRTAAQGPVLEVQRLEEGTSARATRNAATNQLPLQLLTPAGQIEANKILEDLSMYRRLPVIKLQADPRVYSYFTQHPDVAVSIWRAMQISQVQMTQTAPGVFSINTGDGTVGTVTVLHQSEHHHLILCEGEFQGPGITRPMQARALMHLQPHFTSGPDGRSEVTHTLDLFVSFPSQTVQTLARLISPVSNHVADRNFEEVSLFIEMMDMAMSEQPGWMEQIAGRLDHVDPAAPKQLLQVTASVYVDEEKRNVRQTAEVPPEPESVTTPFVRKIFRQ